MSVIFGQVRMSQSILNSHRLRFAAKSILCVQIPLPCSYYYALHLRLLRYLHLSSITPFSVGPRVSAYLIHNPIGLQIFGGTDDDGEDKLADFEIFSVIVTRLEICPVSAGPVVHIFVSSDIIWIVVPIRNLHVCALLR
jgi:hypothetical protein